MSNRAVPGRRSARRGFTLIEVTVVVLVLAILVTGAFLRLNAAREGQQHRAFLQALRRIVVQSREAAIREGQPVRLEYSEGSGFESSWDGETGDRQSVARVQVPDDLTVTRFVAGGNEMSSGDWALMFHPDGTTDGGGVQITREQAVWSLQVDRLTGATRLERETLPDPSEARWQAGDYEQRL
jgi:prepilin-type N-terminal cleavage/methylation domain-containing protein